MSTSLSLQHLSITVEDKEIIHDLSLTVSSGEVHAIMGPNGSGKSTLANTLMGHPKYEVTNGSIILGDTDLTHLPPDARAQAGLFLSMQYPPSVAGVSVSNFLRTAHAAVRKERVMAPMEFHKLLMKEMEVLSIDPVFAQRNLNEGFSGGEKKRMEILQLLLLEPRIAILDETDSGLDVDALKIVTEGIRIAQERFHLGVLLVTHYARILRELPPTRVHIMEQGVITRSGGMEIAERIESEGYAKE